MHKNAEGSIKESTRTNKDEEANRIYTCTNNPVCLHRKLY